MYWFWEDGEPSRRIIIPSTFEGDSLPSLPESTNLSISSVILKKKLFASLPPSRPVVLRLLIPVEKPVFEYPTRVSFRYLRVFEFELCGVRRLTYKSEIVDQIVLLVDF